MTSSFSGLKAALEKGLSILGLQLPAPKAFIPEINLELLRDYATKRGKDAWLPVCSSILKWEKSFLMGLLT